MLALSSQFLFFLSALGAFNGLLLAGYLLATKRSQLRYWFLSALLIMVSVRVGKSVLFFFYPELDKTILQVGLSACFLIGPMTFFYTQSALSNAVNLSRGQRIHISILAGLVVLVGTVFPYTSHTDLWVTYLYKAVNYNWLVYLGLSWFTLHRGFPDKASLFSRDNMLLLSVNLGASAIWLAYFTSSLTSYIVGALSFSFILYVSIVIVFVLKPKPVSYQSKQFDQNTVETLKDNLERTMLADEYYCHPLLSMPQVASKMGVTTAQLSQLLNDSLNKSFTVYVNELRVEKAKSLLQNGQPMTMEVVAEQCGYNSMSTFYSAFKKYTDVTPAKYRAQWQ